MAEELKRLGWTEADRERRPKSDHEKRPIIGYLVFKSPYWSSERTTPSSDTAEYHQAIKIALRPFLIEIRYRK